MKKKTTVAAATQTKATANVPQLKSKALANNSQQSSTTKAPAAQAAPAEEADDIWELKAPPMQGRTATGRGRKVMAANYNVATCNYNDWREWGKFIANGLMRTEKQADGTLKAWAVDGEIIARHVQNRNLDYMPESAQKYGGFVTATEENIPQVIKNIDDFYSDTVNDGVKVFFGILPEFPLTHPVASASPIKNTGLVNTNTGGKNGKVKQLAQRLLAEIGE